MSENFPFTGNESRNRLMSETSESPKIAGKDRRLSENIVRSPTGAERQRSTSNEDVISRKHSYTMFFDTAEETAIKL